MTDEAKILIVDDDEEIRGLIALYLQNHGFRVLMAEEGGQIVELLLREKPDLIILDIVLPDTDGVQLCRRIREHSDIPILFLSCKREADDIIAGLDTGGDDYMTKPFDPLVLVARVKANLRRRTASPQQTREKAALLRFGEVEANLHNYEVRVGGEPVDLFAKERQLLFFLLKHPNQVFSAAQLHDQVWGWDSFSDERTVMVHISNLRRKLERDPSAPRHIRTVRGFGYQFFLDGKL
ncbi:DNA-binding response regulator [Paenibacillus tyrfis]|uniref:response regulator transcription factor n=1 Tax=Paenibacillus tyrfis TaxID=1501230 RepID=UPI0024907D5C|nr:response regulator transcription factor [Paenibacillus tyrfis]GLI08440.1 DNA-binding response regulator [Paenibacillus tyrfis]